MPSDELRRLANILADWVEPAPSLTVYLYGSRVRGDHTPTSDVDVFIPATWNFGAADSDIRWLISEQCDAFRALEQQLPGRLHVLPEDEHLKFDIQSAEVVHRERQVVCVWLPAKHALNRSSGQPREESEA